MAIPLATGSYQANNVDLSGSEFSTTCLQSATFRDVNLKNSVFDDVALTGATFRNICFGNVSIEDANYTGMRINGILVTELLATYRERSE